MNVSTVLPRTFTGNSCQVTVNADRSIIVKPGDWLSKYTMAIWGDTSKPHIETFKRKINGVLSKIDNPNLIKAGETLYVTGRLPGEIGIFSGEDTSGGALPPTTSPKHNVNNALLEVAAQHFYIATRLGGPAQRQSIALGLMQFARGLMNCSRVPAEMQFAARFFRSATTLSGKLQVDRIARGLISCAEGLKNCSDRPRGLEIAVINFNNARNDCGGLRWWFVALGLSQLADGLKNFSSDPRLLQSAVLTFHSVQSVEGSQQLQRIALGLWLFARSLRT